MLRTLRIQTERERERERERGGGEGKREGERRGVGTSERARGWGVIYRKEGRKVGKEENSNREGQ